MPQLARLLKIRERYAYGAEHLFFDDSSLVGFTREGDEEHPDSGVAVILTDKTGGRKRMYLGERFAGRLMADALENISETVTVESDGWGTFPVKDGSVSVWVTEPAWEYLYLNS